MMNSTTYLRSAFSLLFILFAVASANACGPFNPIIPTPEYFALSREPRTMAYYDKQENLRLWQSLTDKRIPLADIEEVVYKDSSTDIENETAEAYSSHGNKFYNYLNNTNDTEITSFLHTAKDMEERWADMKSPWYYPEKRGWYDETGDFEDIIEQCNEYKGSRLKDRYGLQGVRAYFASRRYSACIEYYDSVFCDIPDDNLMKRMAKRYVAGCWSRLGDNEHADSVFAEAGDIWSIKRSDKVEYMVERNPGAPQLIEYIRDNVRDTAFMKDCAKMAKRIVHDRRVKNKGDWYFLMAYVNNEYNHDRRAARSHIQQALSRDFSTEELPELARAYKIKLDAQVCDMGSLLANLQWIESKTNILYNDAHEWERRLQNIVYADFIPTLWKNKDYATAILLCAYADYYRYYDQYHNGWYENDGDYNYDPDEILTIKEIRESEKYLNRYDYSSLSFQLMGSLTSTQLAATYTKIKSSTPLYNYLRRKARTDSDYFNEVIGTLAIREENYDRAVKYLSLVSEHYQRTMNIYKGGYLARDPFAPYPTRWRIIEPARPGFEAWSVEFGVSPHKEKRPQTDAKLNFAKQMRSYARTMKLGKTGDERGMARLMYAIGRRNSFEECWALTQYWRGYTTGLFESYLVYNYEADEFAVNNYSFLFNYYEDIGYEHTEKVYESEIEAAKAMMTTDETRAKAEYILCNLATIVKRYPTTQMAELIRTSCDNWKTWI